MPLGAAPLDPVLAIIAIVASMVGTTTAARVLQAMTDTQFRAWTTRIVTAIAGYRARDLPIDVVAGRRRLRRLRWRMRPMPCGLICWRGLQESRGAVVVMTAVGLKFLRDHRR